ncbi:hypothetical protein MXL22_00540 [Staphylococcus pseudoxylosus]|uniref:hypothetical protein n=1 Tax=Staphylococcus pseudoxylosus TaxID=2282419 RepID=UPI002DBB301B|nr:hypothetical protein [Staphylococcus pseudoxylosus]MEB6059570.1 hypothetical protein [Staphylococcus pseudoxylosus]
MSTLKEICKDQRELLNECRQNIKELTEENEKLKEQIDTSQVSRLIAEKEQLKEEMKGLHEESNITVFCALMEENSELNKENERLERENEKLKATNENLNNRVRNLNLNSQIQHDELMSCDGEVNYWKNLYTTLTNHIRTKAENNPGVSRYIDLVNYIDRLERD